MMKTNKQIEREIEDLYVTWAAETFGIAAKKFEDKSTVGAPDRLCLVPGGKAFFIEFKKPGGVRDGNQIDYAISLSKLGFHVYECTSLESAKLVTTIEMRG